MKAPRAFARHPALVPLALALCPLGAPPLSRADPAPDRPHVVFLLADQWRAQATGYAGDPNVQTPNIDRLAAHSINLKNAVSVCPVCTPYRAALMTGRYPTSTGMFLNDAHLPDQEICIAETFRDAGYSTAYIGKWHLDGHGRSSFIPPARRQGWAYWKGAECDHNYNHSHYYTGDSDEKLFWDGYDAFAQTRDATRYIRDHAGDPAPFLLMVSYGTPHFPHATAPPDLQALYPPEKIRLPPNVPQELRQKALREAQGYYAHCTALDRCVGEVVAALDACGIAGKTILVFTSDHGEMLGSHGCPPLMKQVSYAESAQIPFLLRYPKIHGAGGRTLELPINTPDIFPTLAGLAGLRAPATVEGEDLSGILRGGPAPRDHAALYMSVAPFIPRPHGVEYRALRTARYTYVRGLDGPSMLFDNGDDPHQLQNLVDRPEHAALRARLDARLAEMLERIGDRFRPREEHIAEWGYKIGRHGSVPYTPDATPQTPARQR